MGRGQTSRFVALLLVLAFTGWDMATGFYTTTPDYKIPDTTTPPMCEGEADILFLLDASGSVSRTIEYPQELQFARSVASRFTVGLNNIHFSAIVYSSRVLTYFSFTEHLTNAAVDGALAVAPYFGGGTATGAALNTARTFALTSANGARNGVPKIVIVITDGKSSNPGNTQLEASLLHMTSATVIAVGVGNGVVVSELNTIASDPSLVFQVGNFGALSTIRDQVSRVACPVKDPPCVNNCVGREDGNYAACDPLCQQGFFLSCVNEFTYKMPCALAYYTGHNGNRFLARMVYNPTTDTCELSYDKCPRNPKDHEVKHSHPVHGGKDGIVRYLNNPCLTPYDSCYGRPDGNYPICDPYCRYGYFYTCSNGERYEMPCPLGYYTDSYGNRFTARMVYDTRTDTCELTVPSCPRQYGEIPRRTPYYPDPTTVYHEPTACNGQADILFILDSSGSVGFSNFQVITSFASSLSNNFNLAPDAVQIGAIVFSSNVVNHIRLDAFTTQAALANAFSNAPFFGGTTNTAQALAFARTFGFSMFNGARPNVGKVAIVVTDGISNNGASTANEAANLKATGVTVIAIGIGSFVADAELQAIATSPAHVFRVANFMGLNLIQQQLVTSACGERTCLSYSCAGRKDGNYAACDPLCAQGFYISCVNEFAYKMPCGLAYYTDHHGNRFTARMVYNAYTDTCELSSSKCPRNPEDHKIDIPYYTTTPVNPWNPSCLSYRDSCYGRRDGNYPLCYPECQTGHFITCSNGEAYEMPCPLGWYTYKGKRFTHKMVYDPSSDSCELTVSYCPREVLPKDPHVHPTPTTYYSTQAPCVGQADILIVKDSSGSIGISNYGTMLAFLGDLSNQFPVGQNQFRFSAIVYSTSASIEFSFTDYLDNPSVFQAILNCPYLGGGTDTARALDLARTSGFSSSNGARGSNVPRVVIVITDGISNDPSETARAADRLHQQGITVISIGVVNARQDELRAIASQPSNVFNVTTFSALTQIRDSVVNVACQSQNTGSGCVSSSHDCHGRNTGNYATCDHYRHQDGWYWTCSGGYGHQIQCGVLWCHDSYGKAYTGYGVFNPVTRNCERDHQRCPP